MKKTLIFFAISIWVNHLGLSQNLIRKNARSYTNVDGKVFNYFMPVYTLSNFNLGYLNIPKYYFLDGNDLYVYNSSDHSLYNEYKDLFDMNEENLSHAHVWVSQDIWDQDDDIEIHVNKSYFDFENFEELEGETIIYDHNLNQLELIKGIINSTIYDIVEGEVILTLSYGEYGNSDSTVIYKIRDVISSSSNTVARVNNNMLSASPNPSPRNATVSVKYVLPDNANTGELIFYSLRGEELKRVRVGKHVDHVDVSTSGMPRGMCVYKLKTSEGVVYSNKLIVH